MYTLSWDISLFDFYGETPCIPIIERLAALVNQKIVLLFINIANVSTIFMLTPEFWLAQILPAKSIHLDYKAQMFWFLLETFDFFTVISKNAL